VEKALDKRTSMGIVGNLNDYTRYQAAEAMQTAAANPGGAASAGVGMGVGFGMANELSRAYSDNNRQQSTPPPLPNAPLLYVAINGERTGPFDVATVKQKILSGDITRSTLVWHDPMPEWVAAEKLATLAASFPNLPPPIPT
jgi:GYF domain 2